MNARADKLEKDLDKTRSEFATALGELTKAKKEIQRLAELTAVPPVEPAAKVRPLPASTTVSSLKAYEWTPEDVEMINPYEVRSRSKKARPTAIEIIEPEVEYTPLSDNAVESMEGWLKERAAIRKRNEAQRTNPLPMMASYEGMRARKEAGVARKERGPAPKRTPSPTMTMREWLRSREVDIHGAPRRHNGSPPPPPRPPPPPPL